MPLLLCDILKCCAGGGRNVGQIFGQNLGHELGQDLEHDFGQDLEQKFEHDFGQNLGDDLGELWVRFWGGGCGMVWEVVGKL